MAFKKKAAAFLLATAIATNTFANNIKLDTVKSCKEPLEEIRNGSIEKRSNAIEKFLEANIQVPDFKKEDFNKIFYLKEFNKKDRPPFYLLIISPTDKFWFISIDEKKNFDNKSGIKEYARQTVTTCSTQKKVDIEKVFIRDDHIFVVGRGKKDDGTYYYELYHLTVDKDNEIICNFYEWKPNYKIFYNCSKDGGPLFILDKEK
ncbi:MAG: hypothetical protein QW153_02590 [Candidatus Bilamarchaeaceae archaeon]